MKQRPNLNELAKEAFEDAKVKGFYDNDPSNEHLLMLVITELAEAIEADRKGNRANLFMYEGSNKTNEYYKAFINNTVESELADAVIRLLSLVGYRGIYTYTDINNTCDKVSKTYGFISDVFKHKAFVEIIYYIIYGIYTSEFKNGICLAVSDIENLCKHLNIDLWYHVELKMKYNKSREILHGKKY